MKRSALALVATMFLVGCETTPDPEIRIETRDVLVPVARSCVPSETPAPPVYRVTREALVGATDAAVRLALAVAGFLERDARLAETEPVLAACRD